MKHSVRCSVVFGAVILLAGASLRAADDGVMAPLRMQYETTRGWVVGLVEALPEDKFDYRPTPEVRSLREQLIHIADENYIFSSAITGSERKVDRKTLEALQSKAEIMKALTESYGNGAKVLAGLTDQKALEVVTFRDQQVRRWFIALYNIADNMDHYGNLVVYARLNGVTPPRPPAGQRRR